MVYQSKFSFGLGDHHFGTAFEGVYEQRGSYWKTLFWSWLGSRKSWGTSSFQLYPIVECHPKMVDFELWNLWGFEGKKMQDPPKKFGKPQKRFSLPRFYLSASIHLQDMGDLAADTPLIAGAGGTQLRRDIHIGDPQTRRFTGVYRFLFKMSGYFCVFLIAIDPWWWFSGPTFLEAFMLRPSADLQSVVQCVEWTVHMVYCAVSNRYLKNPQNSCEHKPGYGPGVTRPNCFPLTCKFTWSNLGQSTLNRFLAHSGNFGS